MKPDPSEWDARLRAVWSGRWKEALRRWHPDVAQGERQERLLMAVARREGTALFIPRKENSRRKRARYLWNCAGGGMRIPGAARAVLLAETLHVNLDWLAGLSDNPQPGTLRDFPGDPRKSECHMREHLRQAVDSILSRRFGHIQGKTRRQEALAREMGSDYGSRAIRTLTGPEGRIPHTDRLVRMCVIGDCSLAWMLGSGILNHLPARSADTPMRAG